MTKRRWMACSLILLMLSAASASAGGVRAVFQPNDANSEQLKRIVQYGEGSAIEATTAVKADMQAQTAAEKVGPNEMDNPYDTIYGNGALYIKFEKGYKFQKKDHVTQVSKDNQVKYPDALYYLDYEFPDAIIEPLWGDPTVLASLKERGEKLSGQTLPDLSLWYKVTPDPMLPFKGMIGSEQVGKYRLCDSDAFMLARAKRILRALPGVSDVHAPMPLIRSSMPQAPFWAENQQNFSSYQHQTAPDTYLTDGDYGEHDLGLDFMYNTDCDLTAGTCPVGGINAWPAWDKGFFGNNIPIGYVEEDWCLGNLGGLNVTCHTHPDLAGAFANRVKFLTTDRRYTYFGYPHGTAVFGIMAADHNNQGGKGIAPQSDYYIGQVWSPAEWISVVNRLIALPNNKGDGAIFLMEAAWGCFPNGGIGACPPEVNPEVYDFVRTAVANNIVVVEIPGNGFTVTRAAGMNLDQPLYITQPNADGDFEVSEFDMDNEVELFEDETFEYPDGDVDWATFTPSPKRLIDLNRASGTDSGAILVTAGAPNTTSGDANDPLKFVRRSRLTWSSYGSRVDVHARGFFNIAPIASTADIFNCPNHDLPIGCVCPDCNYTLGYHPILNPQYPNWAYVAFPGTSSCGPTVAAAAALVQQMYKTVRADFLTSPRMRNALVENGNPQVLRAQDQNRTLNLLNSSADNGVPGFLETPNEPFARIGARPDLGNVMYAFGLENGTSDKNIRYHLPFENHQRYLGVRSKPMGSYYTYIFFPYFAPSEPFAKNVIYPPTNDWGTLSSVGVEYVRSPRISGGFAIKLTPPSSGSNLHEDGRYLQVAEDSTNSGDIFHPHRGSSALNNFTLSAWILLNGSTGSDQYIFYKGTDTLTNLEYALYIDSGMHLCSAIGTTGGRKQTCSTALLTTNQVYHVATVVRNATATTTAISVYINGSHSGTTTYTASSISRVLELPDVGFGFKGIIDDILFEDYALEVNSGNTCSTLASRYAADANPPNLVSYWHFDVKDATTIADPVNGYSGTLSTATNFYNAWGAGVPIGNFDTTQYITVADPLDTTNPPPLLKTMGGNGYFSVEAHFKIPPVSSTEHFLISRGTSSTPAWSVSWVNGHARFKVKTTGGTTYEIYSDSFTADEGSNRWVHLLAVYGYREGVLLNSPRLMSIYLDGVRQVGTPATVSGGVASPASPIFIGTINGGTSTNRWNTPVEYVRLYNAELTSTKLVPFGTTIRSDLGFLYDSRASLWKNSYFKR